MFQEKRRTYQSDRFYKIYCFFVLLSNKEQWLIFWTKCKEERPVPEGQLLQNVTFFFQHDS